MSRALLLALLTLQAHAAPGTPVETRTAVVTAAAAAYADAEVRFSAGSAPADEVYQWSKRWLSAQGADPAAAKAHAARMDKLTAALAAKIAAGMATASEAKASAFYTAEAAFLLQ